MKLQIFRQLTLNFCDRNFTRKILTSDRLWLTLTRQPELVLVITGVNRGLSRIAKDGDSEMKESPWLITITNLKNQAQSSWRMTIPSFAMGYGVFSRHSRRRWLSLANVLTAQKPLRLSLN